MKMNGLFCVFAVCIAASKCEVRTVNNATNLEAETMETTTIAGIPGVNISAVTDSFCPSRKISESDRSTRRLLIQQNTGATFYLKYRALRSPLPFTALNKFPGLLSMADHIGLHELVILPNNLSTEELESALYYAWQPAIESYIHNTGKNVTGVSILFFFGSGLRPGITETGSDVRPYIYTLTVSDISHRNTATVRQCGKYSSVPLLKKVPAPNRGDFLRRLTTKHVFVHEGPTFIQKQVILKGSQPTLNLEQWKLEFISELEKSYNKSYTNRDSSTFENSPCNMSKGDVNLLLGPPLAAVIIPMVDNGYSQMSAVTYLPYMITVKGKFYASHMESSFMAKQRTNEIPPIGILRQNKTLLFSSGSFRLYSSLPVNFQLLPILGKSVAKFLDNKLGSSNLSTAVRFGFPNLDNATTVNLIIRLAINNETILDLDSRLFYGKQIYNHLEADPQRQTFLQNCKDGQTIVEETGYGDCPLSETFTLHLSQTSGQFPSAAEIIRLVNESFAEANPVTLGEAYFVISLRKREDLFGNSQGLRIVRFDFSFSYFNLESGNFWNVWRFPTDAIVRRLSALNPPIAIGYVFNKLLSSCTVSETEPESLSKKCDTEGLSLDNDTALPNSSFSLYLVGIDTITKPNVSQHYRISPTEILRENQANILRAVADAFSEANPQKTGESATVTLIGYDDDLWTLDGNPVTKYDFTLMLPGTEPSYNRRAWRYLTRKVLQMHLQKTASVEMTDDELY